MDFQIGDQVVHWSYGPGKIILLEEKEILNQKTLYYVVKIGDLTMWVPVEVAGKSSLRLLTPAAKFDKLFAILSSPGEPLSIDRMERRIQLSERMKAGRLDVICQVIRDLWLFKQTQKMSEQDSTVLRRAQAFLLNEWTLSLMIPHYEADETLQQLLGESLVKSNVPLKTTSKSSSSTNRSKSM